MTLMLVMMMQCYAAVHNPAGCDPYRVYDDAALCRKLAREWTAADRKALRLTHQPAIVDYKCMPIE
jgi:hypothetical protein